MVRFLLLFGLISGVAIGTLQAQSFTPQQKSELRELMRQFILENPSLLIESLEALQETEQREQVGEAIRENQAALLEDPRSPVMGNPTGAVTVVEFFDYACGFCKQVLPHVLSAIDKDSEIRLIMKELPILGDSSVYASRTGLAIWKHYPEAYSDYHNQLMGHQGHLTETVVDRLARQLGLDLQLLERERDSQEISDMIDDTYALARNLTIRGTPAFIFGETLIPGALSLEAMEDLIERMKP